MNGKAKPKSKIKKQRKIQVLHAPWRHSACYSTTCIVDIESNLNFIERKYRIKKKKTKKKLKSYMLYSVEKHAVVQPAFWFSNQTQTSMNVDLESKSKIKIKIQVRHAPRR
jgi:hypothetical protein